MRAEAPRAGHAQVALIVALALAGCGAPGAAPAERGVAASAGALSVDSLGSGVPTSVILDRDHVLYLTFDDGPDGATTPEVLRVLAAHGAPATFFITGWRIDGNEALLRQEAAAGHQVANHQLLHEVAPPPGRDGTFRDWALRERVALDRALGHRHARYFRYPYGEGSSAKERVLRDLGYSDGGTGWDVDSLDWCYGDGGGACDRPEVPTAYRDDFVAYVRWRVAAQGSGGVLLLHDVQQITAERLDELLTGLEADGLRFGALPPRP